MTSGVFHSISIDSIRVDRESRQRKEPKGIDELADSIKRHGLIHPIVATREWALVAGERRLLACRFLGHTNIVCQYTDELDPLALQGLELEENVKRENLSWQEQLDAVKKYHDLKRQMDPNWSQSSTAEALGFAAATICEWLKVIKATETQPKLLSEKFYSTARNAVKRQEDRKTSSALTLFRESFGSASAQNPVQVADFHEWAESYSGPKSNFIHCDFPYGIYADQIHQGAVSSHMAATWTHPIHTGACWRRSAATSTSFATARLT